MAANIFMNLEPRLKMLDLVGEHLRAQVVWETIAAHANWGNGGRCYPSNALIMHYSRVKDRQSFKRIINFLVSVGLLKIVRVKRGGMEYEIPVEYMPKSRKFKEAEDESAAFRDK